MGKNKDQKNKESKKDQAVSDPKPKLGKGRDTMFRTVSMTQLTQNQIADNKASIMISINTTIISALVAVTAYSSDSGFLEGENRFFLLPILCIILTALVSIVFAIQSARPKVVNILKTQAKKSSLFFFGVIASFTQEEFINELEGVLNNGDDVYRHMAIDLHNQGIVLKRKFNLLSYSYQAFLVGLVLSVVLFMGLIVVV